LFLAVWSGTASATDHVVPGTQLRLRHTPNGGTMTLLLRDVTAIPSPGSSDDPSTAGMVVTLFGRTSAQKALLVAPPGTGRPGWVVRSAPRITYSYTNPSAGPETATLNAAVLRSGNGLRARARSSGLGLGSAEGAIAVRVEWGSERVCTIFDGDAVRRDEAGFFFAAKADAPGITDCNDSTLSGGGCGSPDDQGVCGGTCPGDAECGGNLLIGCSCVSPSQPCGDSAPVCNGECPAGEECSVTGGGPFTSCGCLPIGSMACGEQQNSCDAGACPPGTSCYGFSLSVLDYCACASEPPPDPCNNECPTGWTCVGPRPGFPAMCIPPFCNGGSGAPVCGGSCDGGAPNDTCTAVSGACVCVEHCSGGDPFPTCGGTCSSPNATCVAVDGKCFCSG
jgi:hypothetical protein